MSLSLILFDVDGTLIDGHRAGRGSLVRAFARTFGLDLRHVDTLMDRVAFAGLTDGLILRETAHVLGVSLDGRRDALVRRYLDELRHSMTTRPARVLPGVVELLGALRQHPDRTVGLLTGNMREGSHIKLASCGLDTFFEDGGFGDDGLERAEIARAAHRRFEERLGRPLAPKDVAVVGDTHHDVEAARACGFVSVAVDTGFGDPELLRRSTPDVHLPDLTDPSWLREDRFL